MIGDNYEKVLRIRVICCILAVAYHRGHFCNLLPSDFPSVYAFSKPLNPLDYDTKYPKNPKTLAEYIRKYRKDKGLLCRELAARLGVTKITVMKWEGGRLPRPTYLGKLKKIIPELAAITRDS